MRQDSVLDIAEAELLERVEAVAATGNKRAAALLRSMVEERFRTGEIHLFSRLQARPYLLGDRHAR